MTEEEARQWVLDRYGQRLSDSVAAFADMVVMESVRQNLVSKASLDAMWVRHVVDSAQLLAFANETAGTWIDIGTGAGFPGMIVAILRDSPMVMVEPRRRRAEFLQDAAERLSIAGRVTVVAKSIERVEQLAAIISARAVASLEALFDTASQCAGADTLWVMPKGRTALDEVARAKRSWHGVFHVEQSITDPEAKIVIASKVSRR